MDHPCNAGGRCHLRRSNLGVPCRSVIRSAVCEFRRNCTMWLLRNISFVLHLQLFRIWNGVGWIPMSNIDIHVYYGKYGMAFYGLDLLHTRHITANSDDVHWMEAILICTWQWSLSILRNMTLLRRTLLIYTHSFSPYRATYAVYFLTGFSLRFEHNNAFRN